MNTLPTEIVVSVLGFVDARTLVLGVGLTCSRLRNILLGHFVKQVVEKREVECISGYVEEKTLKLTVSNHEGETLCRKVVLAERYGKDEKVTTTGRKIRGKRDGVWTYSRAQGGEYVRVYAYEVGEKHYVKGELFYTKYTDGTASFHKGGRAIFTSFGETKKCGGKNTDFSTVCKAWWLTTSRDVTLIVAQNTGVGCQENQQTNEGHKPKDLEQK